MVFLFNSIAYVILKWLFQHRIKLIGLLAMTFLFVESSKAQQSEKTISVDTCELSISWDSSYIKLNKSIKGKDYWVKILGEDTTLISFFKMRGNKKPCYIYIASIERFNGSPLQYELMIYSNPITISLKELVGFGYATYHITLASTTKGKQIISDIVFNGLVM